MGAGGSLSGALSVDTISEKTSGSGVTIDSLNVKDGGIGGHQIGGRRNIIINGGMQVAQRGTSSTSSAYASVDRFAVSSGNLDNLAFTQAQVADAPDDSGLEKSFKFTVTTAESALSAGEFLRIYHPLEGQDIQQFKWGTSSGEQVTVSFFVKSSITGTFACSIYIFDANVIMNKPYTISSANTWEQKTLTFPAYTAGGSKVPANDNTAGIYLQWGLLAGSSYNTLVTDWTAYGNGESLLGGQTANVGAVNSTTWQITGVQLEVGSQATPFEHRSFGEELALCQRYFEHDDSEGSDNYRFSMNKGTTSASYYFALPYCVTKRAKPTATVTQAYSDNFVLSAHSGSSGRGHMGLVSTASGSTDTRALFEFTWTADAEL
tara:strand:+ start:406 stop:1536 length:1131 start_codon:yes stop_codon:yes gene_type:complete